MSDFKYSIEMIWLSLVSYLALVFIFIIPIEKKKSLIGVGDNYQGSSFNDVSNISKLIFVNKTKKKLVIASTLYLYCKQDSTFF